MEEYAAIEGASQSEEFILSSAFCNVSTITDQAHDQVGFSEIHVSSVLFFVRVAVTGRELVPYLASTAVGLLLHGFGCLFCCFCFCCSSYEHKQAQLG